MNPTTRQFQGFKNKVVAGTAVLGLFGLLVMIVTTILVGVVMMLAR